jgi:hypothetical protein
MRTWKPIFIENSRIPKILSYVSPISIGAITLGFIVFARGEIDATTRQHETIHFQQFLETAFAGFFLLYFYDYIKNYITMRDGQLAYFNIRAEKEAYKHEKTKDYLQHRKRWAWIIK